LGIDDDYARPELVTVFAKNLGVIIFLKVVSFGDEGWKVEGRGEDADAEVIIAGEVRVVRHGCEEGKQSAYI
jgi:hypothetical protein